MMLESSTSINRFWINRLAGRSSTSFFIFSFLSKISDLYAFNVSISSLKYIIMIIM